MPLSGTLPSHFSGSLSWPPSSSSLILLAVALFLFGARRYSQGCYPSRNESQLSRTATSEKDRTAVSHRQLDSKTLEQIQCDTQLATPSRAPLPPISDASGAILSHQHTISHSGGSEIGTRPQTTQNEGISHLPYNLEPYQGHASSYYQDTNTFAFDEGRNSTAATFREPEAALITNTESTSNEPCTTGKYPHMFTPPIHYTTHLPPGPSVCAESAKRVMHPGFNATMHPYSYSLHPVSKQRETLQVFRGVGPEKGRTWRRKVLEYS